MGFDSPVVQFSSEKMGVDVFTFLYKNLQVKRFKKPYIAGSLMAGSVATLAILWVSLQTMGFLGSSHTIGAYKLPMSLQNYLASYTGLPMINYPHEGVVDTGHFHNRRFPHVDEAVLNNSISFAKKLVDRMSTLERNIANAGVELLVHTPAGKQFLDAYPSEDAFERGLDAAVAMKASSYLLQQSCHRFGFSKDECARYISTLSLQGTPLSSACSSSQSIVCNPKAKYRSIDGTCNNVENPSWGSAMTAYTRILFPQYFDGIQEPRYMGRMKKPLPSARSVSVALSTPNDLSDVSRTLTVVQWGQFIANDISHTPMRKMMSSGRPITCCHPDGSTLSPRHIHPDCSPIAVPDRDPVYGQHYIKCMNYVRSLPVLRSECNFGPVEQMNQVSHFLDGSAIYGSTLKRARKLRAFESGRLRVFNGNSHEFLPHGGDMENSPYCTLGCYDSDDHRVNTQPQLAVIHTVWHREHNRIADQLATINPHWSDETLYQEARRIVIAEIQHVTYKEWLPILLGKRYTRAIGVNSGNSYSNNYNSEGDPAVSNEVATAALRFMTFLMQGKLSLTDNARRINQTLPLGQYFYKPRVIETDDVFDGLLRGMATQTSQRMDISAIEDITSKLYATNRDSLGLDGISLDIQRGRDHGLPGYNHYRRYCGLPTAKTFDDFLDYIPLETIKKLRDVYVHPDDVDLLMGGVAERPSEDGLLGPTFRCLIFEQFSRTYRTDRYFYDSAYQPHPFTPSQLAEIRNVTLARVFCDNGNSITQMQSNVFLRPQPGNKLRSCTDFEAIPSVDLFAWAERAKAYR